MAKEHNTYCEFVERQEEDNVHRIYHDSEYGFPIEDDNGLLNRLALEINQAGLNWTTILNKKENFFKAFSGFDVETLANYTEEDKARLLADAGIIRNKLKVNAVIYNAQQILEMRKTHGSFKAWLDSHHPLSLEEWVKLFKKTFKFTGGEITKEFLTSSGYLEGAHHAGCSVYEEILKHKPMWLKNKH